MPWIRQKIVLIPRLCLSYCSVYCLLQRVNYSAGLFITFEIHMNWFQNECFVDRRHEWWNTIHMKVVLYRRRPPAIFIEFYAFHMYSKLTACAIQDLFISWHLDRIWNELWRRWRVRGSYNIILLRRSRLESWSILLISLIIFVLWYSFDINSGIEPS
jgi:hypothetical protein